MAASKAAMRGATILKASDDKTRELNSHSLMAFSGEAGDTGMLNLLYHSFLFDTHSPIPLSTSTTILAAEPYNWYTNPSPSSIRRIHPGKHSTILYAQCHGIITISHRKFCPWRAG